MNKRQAAKEQKLLYAEMYLLFPVRYSLTEKGQKDYRPHEDDNTKAVKHRTELNAIINDQYDGTNYDDVLSAIRRKAKSITRYNGVF